MGLGNLFQKEHTMKLPGINPFKFGTQNYRILSRLRQGPVTNVEMYDPKKMNIPRYGGRIYDINNALKPWGFEVEQTTVHKGLREYRLVSI